MNDVGVTIEQLDEALEERGGSDRRKENAGACQVTGEDRRKEDRRKEEG